MASNLEQTISETVDSTRDYIQTLTDLLKQLESVENQVKITATKTKGVIDHHFPYVVGVITSLLDQRQTTLQKQVAMSRDETLGPLESCKVFIQGKLKNAQIAIAEGENIIRNGNVPINVDVASFCEKASLLGSVPEIPSPTSVSNITVNFDENVLSAILSSLRSYGSVTTNRPVHIYNTESHPGALLLNWQEADQDDVEFEPKFRLQFCKGNVYKDNKNKSFQDVYVGNENSFLCRALVANQPYSFRIACCHHDDQDNWGEWSRPIVAETVLPHYEFNQCEFYCVTNEARIATRVTETTCGLCITKNPVVKRGIRWIRFRILQMGLTANIDEGLGLMDIRGHPSTSKFGFGADSVYLNPQGAICVGDKQMTSRLPQLKRDCVVLFVLEPLKGKLRVTIESCDQQIICDWKCGDLQMGADVRAAIFFRCNNWKIEID